MNIVELIKTKAKSTPFKKAVIYQNARMNHRGLYSHYTYQDLDRESDALAHTFEKMVIKQKTKVLLFIRPSLEFPLVVFTLFKIGAIPILIDPGMGLKNLLRAIKEVRPDVLIAVPIVHLIRQVFRHVFKSVRLSISTGGFGFFTYSLDKMIRRKQAHGIPKEYPFFHATDEDLAAILFTSGGTGKPKGVCYTHGIFASQVLQLKEIFSLNETDKDMPGFPLFSLTTIAMGVTSVIAPMNPSKPARVDPKLLVDTILEQGVTTLGGSPVIWEKVANYCMEQDIKLPSIKSIMMFGAPVPEKILRDFQIILPAGETYTPYGATECLPVSVISGLEVIHKTSEYSRKGKGTCVGYPAPRTTIKIIQVSDEVISHLHECVFLRPFEIGEIIVTGPQVTPSYYEAAKNTRLAKIYTDQEDVWHRMGDLGYLDDDGKLWFCGRKAHHFAINKTTFYSIPSEAIFNAHPDIKRTALVSLGEDVGIVIERYDRKTRLQDSELLQFKTELLQLAKQEDHTKTIDNFFLHKDFPVDPRHNIKIDRQYLSRYFSQHIEKRL